MGMAYGQPLKWDGATFNFDEAQSAAMRHNIAGTEALWRVEAVRYSYIADAESERYDVTDPKLELFLVSVRRWTSHGARLYSGRWVDLRDGAKQWASRTPAQALDQFALRRERQIYILERQLARARNELALCTPHPFLACPS